MKIVLLDSVVNDIEISSTARGLKKKHEVDRLEKLFMELLWIKYLNF